MRDSAYPAESERKYGIREYTVDAVANIVTDLQPPPEQWMRLVPPGITTALGVFICYMMLDAWVANQDRHHQNWGAILKSGRFHLAPTFDHGASHARNLRDEESRSRLETRDRGRSVEQFAAKARSGFYGTPQDQKTLFALDAFLKFAECDQRASAIWLPMLKNISQDAVDAILAEVPPDRMSPVTRAFTMELLRINQRRLISPYL